MALAVLAQLLLVAGRPPCGGLIHARSSRVKRPAIRWSAFRAGWGQRGHAPSPLADGPALGKLLVELEGRKVLMSDQLALEPEWNASAAGSVLAGSARAAAAVSTRLPPSQVLELHANGSQRQMRTDYASILQQLQLSVRDLRMLRSHAAEIVVHESRIVYDLGELKASARRRAGGGGRAPLPHAAAPPARTLRAPPHSAGLHLPRPRRAARGAARGGALAAPLPAHTPARAQRQGAHHNHLHIRALR